MSGNNSNDTEGDRASFGLLEEALGLFQRCFRIQEKEYQQFRAQLAAASENAQTETTMPENVQSEQASSNNTAPQANEEEQWVSVREPVTKDGLVDTLLALVGALSVLCSRSSRLKRDAEKYLHNIKQFATPELLQKLCMYASRTEREVDVAVGQACLVSAILEIKYRGGVNDFRVRFLSTASIYSKTNYLDLGIFRCRRRSMGSPRP